MLFMLFMSSIVSAAHTTRSNVATARDGTAVATFAKCNQTGTGLRVLRLAGLIYRAPALRLLTPPPASLHAGYSANTTNTFQSIG